MGKPTEAQKRVSDKKRAIILNRINRAGGVKKAIKPNTSRKQFNIAQDKDTQSFKREIESNSE